jgi:hypothetical protein
MAGGCQIVVKLGQFLPQRFDIILNRLEILIEVLREFAKLYALAVTPRDLDVTAGQKLPEPVPELEHDRSYQQDDQKVDVPASLLHPELLFIGLLNEPVSRKSLARVNLG